MRNATRMARALLSLTIVGATIAIPTIGLPAEIFFKDSFEVVQTIATDTDALNVGEAGSSIFGVRLTLQPPGNVTVSVASSDTGAATVSPTTLNFTMADFSTFQAVGVSGVDDPDTADETVLTTLSSPGVGNQFVTVNVIDNDILFALTVIRAGNGSGTVTSSPAGINCGADCSENYNAGTSVTLTAAPSFNSTFTGWTGGGCSGTGTCTVNMNAATTVTATFTLNSFALTVIKAGNGSGTVTSSPAGINCGADCSETYSAGTSVTLTAAPSFNSTFTGWTGGGCSGTGTCTVNMNAATTVTATFTLNTFALTVTRSGTGTGTVTSSPAGINCGADCSESYNAGTIVTLTAAPGMTSTFSGWSGGSCAGTGTCVVTMNSARIVTASFSSVAIGERATPSD